MAHRTGEELKHAKHCLRSIYETQRPWSPYEAFHEIMAYHDRNFGFGFIGGRHRGQRFAAQSCTPAMALSKIFVFDHGTSLCVGEMALLSLLLVARVTSQGRGRSMFLIASVCADEK